METTKPFSGSLCLAAPKRVCLEPSRGFSVHSEQGSVPQDHVLPLSSTSRRPRSQKAPQGLLHEPWGAARWSGTGLLKEWLYEPSPEGPKGFSKGRSGAEWSDHGHHL